MQLISSRARIWTHPDWPLALNHHAVLWLLKQGWYQASRLKNSATVVLFECPLVSSPEYHPGFCINELLSHHIREGADLNFWFPQIQGNIWCHTKIEGGETRALWSCLLTCPQECSCGILPLTSHIPKSIPILAGDLPQSQTSPLCLHLLSLPSPPAFLYHLVHWPQFWGTSSRIPLPPAHPPLTGGWEEWENAGYILCFYFCRWSCWPLFIKMWEHYTV